VKRETGTILAQVLADPGQVRARDEVRRIEQVLAQCPELHAGSVSLTMSPLRVRQFGDRSVAMAYTLRVEIQGAEQTYFTMRGLGVVVAYQNVSLNLVIGRIAGISNSRMPYNAADAAELAAIATTAMHNLSMANQ
jgi:hypothetical protein